ncbi:MAG: hypothetical protein JOZ22_09635 [Acidobacteriia bacterium]|nr:hypothetical protein [Terriglobia bacterium]MBV9742444.1 hypothetical protein [Terriglobia bacterium]
MAHNTKNANQLEASPEATFDTARFAAALNPNWQQVCNRGALPSPAHASGTVEFLAHAISTLSREKEG